MTRYWNDSLYLQEDELAHHGVLGMHWGVRRYQNADGSYTAAGLKRQQKQEAKAAKKAAKKELKSNIKSAKKDYKKWYTYSYLTGNDSRGSKSRAKAFKKNHGYDVMTAQLAGVKKMEKIKASGKSASEKKKATNRAVAVGTGKYLAAVAFSAYMVIDPVGATNLMVKGLNLAAKGVNKAAQGSIDAAYLVKAGMDKVAPLIKEAKIKANPNIVDVDATVITNAIGKVKMASLY